MSEEDRQPRPPAVLFRSFLLIAGFYVLNILVMGAATVFLLAFFFPDSFEILNADKKAFKTIFETEPERVFPPVLLWILLGISAAVCFVLGYFVARLAPISKFPHSIFFSAILFVQYLQMAIGATDTMQRMFVLFMAVSPVAAILGANWYLRSIWPKE